MGASPSLLGLILQIDADPSHADAAVQNFAQRTGQSMGMVEGQVRSYNTSLKSAYDEAATASRGAADEMDRGLLSNRESTRLLSQELGVRLPRGVTSAMGSMLPQIATLGPALLGAFAIAELPKFISWIHQATDDLAGLGKEAKAVFTDAVQASNDAMVHFKDIKTGISLRNEINQNIAALTVQRMVLDQTGGSALNYAKGVTALLSGQTALGAAYIAMARTEAMTTEELGKLERERAAQLNQETKLQGEQNKTLADYAVQILRVQGEEAKRAKNRSVELSTGLAALKAEQENEVRAHQDSQKEIDAIDSLYAAKRAALRKQVAEEIAQDGQVAARAAKAAAEAAAKPGEEAQKRYNQQVKAYGETLSNLTKELSPVERAIQSYQDAMDKLNALHRYGIDVTEGYRLALQRFRADQENLAKKTQEFDQGIDQTGRSMLLAVLPLGRLSAGVKELTAAEAAALPVANSLDLAFDRQAEKLRAERAEMDNGMLPAVKRIDLAYHTQMATAREHIALMQHERDIGKITAAELAAAWVTYTEIVQNSAAIRSAAMKQEAVQQASTLATMLGLQQEFVIAEAVYMIPKNLAEAFGALGAGDYWSATQYFLAAAQWGIAAGKAVMTIAGGGGGGSQASATAGSSSTAGSGSTSSASQQRGITSVIRVELPNETAMIPVGYVRNLINQINSQVQYNNVTLHATVSRSVVRRS